MRNLYVILLMLVCTNIYAANDLDDWNGNVSKEVRQKLNNDTTTYKTLSSVKATAEQSSSKYTDSLTRSGSKVGVTIDALKVPTSKTDIAKAFLARHQVAIKNVAKGGAYTFVGSAALGVLIKGIGWVMDQGGNVTKKSDNIYSGDACIIGSITCEQYCQNSAKTSGRTFSHLELVYDSYWGNRLYCVTNTGQKWAYLTSYKLNSSSVPSVSVSTNELSQAIQDQLTNAPNSDLSNQLATDAYTLQDSSGKATDSLAKADTTSGINDPAKTLVDAAKSAIANDANPQNAKLTSGSSGKAETETETKNEDGTTGEPSKSSTNFQLPAFCDWASYVCEFIDWVKEDPEQPESIELPTTELTERSFVENLFKVTASCPPDNTLTLPLPHGPVFTYTFTYTRFCSYLDVISYIFVAVAYYWAASIVVRS